jgi:hypothetical protein
MILFTADPFGPHIVRPNFVQEPDMALVVLVNQSLRTSTPGNKSNAGELEEYAGNHSHRYTSVIVLFISKMMNKYHICLSHDIRL